MRTHYKNITEAMAVERPNDKIIKVLSNKFCIARAALIGGGHSEFKYVMGTGSGTTVYCYGDLRDIAHHYARYIEPLSNVKKELICYDHTKNGRSVHYMWKNVDNRRYKKRYRRLLKLL